MTNNFFSVIEVSDPTTLAKFLKGGEKYGMSSFFGMSTNYQSDISAINQTIDYARHLQHDQPQNNSNELKFNKTFFMHLDDNCCFGTDSYSDDSDQTELDHILLKATVRNEDGEILAQVSACTKSSNTNNLLSEKDHHFTKETVSFKSTLN